MKELARLGRVEAEGSALVSTRTYRIEIANGTVIEAAVLVHEDRVQVPIQVTPGKGGYARGYLEFDRKTWDDSVAWSRKRGLTYVRLAALAERFLGQGLVTMEERPRLPRNVGGGEWGQ